MSKSFDELWRFVCQRSAGFPVVQEYHELEYVFNLIKGCESYLEVGTAEGNSLYILTHALKDNAAITYVDFGEKHTREPREEAVKLTERFITGILGNSHSAGALKSPLIKRDYEVVLIDAGHTYEDVIADAIAYGTLATKYIIFHDVCLPEVAKAFEWYCQQCPECRAYKMINSETFGYGILEIKQ